MDALDPLPARLPDKAESASPPHAPAAARRGTGLRSRGVVRPLVVVAWAVAAALTTVVSAASFVELSRQRSLDVVFRGGILALNAEMRTGLSQVGLSEDVILRGVFIFRLIGFTVFTITGLLIFARRPNRMTALVSAMLLLLGASWFAPVTVLAGSAQWSVVLRLMAAGTPWEPTFLNSLPGVVALAFLFVFPDGRFVPRWGRLVVAAAAVQLVVTMAPGVGLETVPAPVQLITVVVIGACGLGAQLYRYFVVSTGAQQRQTIFVLGGIASIAVISPLLQLSPRLGEGLSDLTVVTPRIEAIYELILLVLLGAALLMLPISIFVAVLRYGLWDIQVFVNRALVYGGLTALVAGVYLAGVLLIGGVLGLVLGRFPASNIAVLGSTVAATLLFQPARRRLQEEVDRRFFRQKFDAVQTLERFNHRLREDVDLESLVGDLLSVVGETMQPTHVSLQLRNEEGSLLVCSSLEASPSTRALAAR